MLNTGGVWGLKQSLLEVVGGSPSFARSFPLVTLILQIRNIRVCKNTLNCLLTRN